MTNLKNSSQKSADALRNIREISEILAEEIHVIRFWEQKFPWVTPVRKAGGRRYYRREDIELLQIIKVLLRKEGLSIKGAQKLIRETSRSQLVSTWLPLVDSLKPQEIKEDSQVNLPLEMDAKTISLPARQKHVLNEIMNELINIKALLENEKISYSRSE